MTPTIRWSVDAAASAVLLTFVMAGTIPTIVAQGADATKTKTKTKAKAKTKTEAPEETPPAREAPDPTRRVPSHFGALGLTNEQKEEIYAIQAKYLPQIQELQRKSEGLRERLMSDCEDVLTPPQNRRRPPQSRLESESLRFGVVSLPAGPPSPRRSGFVPLSRFQ